MFQFNKVLIFFVSFWIIALNSNCQIILNVGPDTTYCKSLFNEDTLILGTDMKIMNAQGSVSYTWDCKYVVSEALIFTAGHFLDDTSSQHPRIIDYLSWPDWITFVLNIKDSLGNHDSDSLRVRFSSFSYAVGEIQHVIDYGDSILFSDALINGGIKPLSFNWIPEKWLSDPDTLITWCKPDSSITYSQIVTDSLGCISEVHPAYIITVKPVDIERSEYVASIIKQNGTIVKFNNPPEEKIKIIVYSLNGILLAKEIISNDQVDLADLLLESGIYIAHITIKDSEYIVKFIKPRE